MDYERHNAIFRKVLIVFAQAVEPSRARADDFRFNRFATILSELGHVAERASPTCIEQLADVIQRFKPDIVFCAADHLPARQTDLPQDSRDSPRYLNTHGWLEEKGIPYIGSSPEVIELALSKASLKKKWLEDGIATPAFYGVDSVSGFASVDDALLPPFPCIVKPSDAGNSRGISKNSVVFDRKGLATLVEELGKDFRRVLIEHYLGLYPDFREITCACVGNGAERRLMPAELLLKEPGAIRVITTEDKDKDNTRAVAIRDASLNDGAKAFAAKAFLSAGVRDYSRCDLAFANGKFWAIEVNGQPMIPDSWFEACAKYSGLTERQYILAILGAAMDRIVAGRHSAR